MRASQTCLKCRSRKLFVVDPVRRPGDASRRVDPPIGVTAHRGIDVGTVEAWICAQCGYTEYYAKNAAEHLARLAVPPTQTAVRYLDGEPASGEPYR
jgi:predicted nucleic-acid-binding Zn-ribbon protein